MQKKQVALVAVAVVLATIVVVLGAIAVLIPGIYVRDTSVVSAVEKQGYSDVTTTNSHFLFVSWRGCSKGDDACYKMEATNSRGQRVKIIACAGWPFKGVTVRTK